MKEQKKILVVDDNAAVRAMLREMLLAGGYAVIGEAADAAEGIKMCKRLHPDAVTLDVMMEKEGKAIADINKTVEAVQEILEYDPKIKVIIVSGLAYKDILEGFLNVGVAGCLAKPFTNEELFTLMRKTFEVKKGSEGE